MKSYPSRFNLIINKIQETFGLKTSEYTRITFLLPSDWVSSRI